MQAFVRLTPNLPFSPHRTPRPRFFCSRSLEHLTPPPALSTVRHFLLLSDLHVKRETASTCLRVLQFAHRHAAQRNAAILFLGDFWHARGALPVEPLNLMLTELQTWNVPVIMIPGNHDLISRTGHGVSLVPLATTLGSDKCLLITTPAICLGALFLPYLHEKARLREVMEMVKSGNYGVEAVFCHTEVEGARLTDRIVVKESAELAPADFPSTAPVYSGHLHRPHMVGERIRYVGSPYEVSAAEAGQQKSLVVIDRLRGWQVVERIPIDVGPRHRVLRVGEQLKSVGELRRGDRITVQVAGGEDGNVRRLVGELRNMGARVETQMVTEAGSGEVETADPLTPAEPRISGGALSNIGLFQEYGGIKNLGKKIVEMGKEILLEVGGKASTLQTSISGKDVVIEWETVTLRGFGSFLEKVTYPLRKRGLVLMTGRYCDDEGAVTGRTNGTGKTTLVMAALWALTGRTDARPGGSVEKGVSLEMVHDDAKDCEVTVKLTLRGDRVYSEAHDMMTADERLQAKLRGNGVTPSRLDMLVTRTSARPSALSKNRSYRQELHLKVNGIDLTCLELKETQVRIDRLINGMLLPHTVFFGQHMGAGRGLVDSTDRTLKDHLALIFPLDIWNDARKCAREKALKLQELLLVFEAKLEAANAMMSKLSTAEVSYREQSDEFEFKRNQRINVVEDSIREMLSSFSRWDEDSIVYDENFAVSAEDLTRVITDYKTSLCMLDDEVKDDLDNSRATAAASVARAVAALEAAEELSKRVSSLVRKADEWESTRSRNMDNINSLISNLERELHSMGSREDLNARWNAAAQELKSCEEALNELMEISIQRGQAANTAVFSDEFHEVLSARQRARVLEEKHFRLKASLDEVNDRLQQSEKLSLIPDNTLLQEQESLISNLVACETCLRPFDGKLYAEARSKLEKEAAAIKSAIREADEKRKSENHGYEHAMTILRRRIDVERTKLLDRKAATSTIFNRVRSARESRNTLWREIQEFKNKVERLKSERNLYLDELSEVIPKLQQIEGELLTRNQKALRLSEEKVSTCQSHLKEAKHQYEAVLAQIESEGQYRVARAAKRSSVQARIDDLVQLQSRCFVLENEKHSLRSEANPLQEPLRMLTEELTIERTKVEQREREFASLKDTLNILKSLDVAFGPRGVPSFVLEEGLMWLEKLTGQYLQELSAGELVLQIRAFSDYKSSNRADGDNKEIISKRVFVMNRRSPSNVRERSLRQLSGGQRRRCSLAFALAFADLAHERAGFQSSLIVMDEILQSLDEDGRHRLSKVLPRLLGEGFAARDTLIVVAQDEAPEIACLARGGIDIVTRDLDHSRVLLNGEESC